MTLAYVFWHRPQADVEASEYEEALLAFHSSLDRPSASFRLARLPFAADRGYEDWYLVEGWAELGVLNAQAVDDVRRPTHDAVARLAAEGWGGVYKLILGRPTVPEITRWMSKPAAESYGAFLASQEATAIWQRQMVLGPGREFCLVANETVRREHIAERDVARVRLGSAADDRRFRA